MKPRQKIKPFVRITNGMSGRETNLVHAFSRVDHIPSAAGWLVRELKEAGLYERALAEQAKRRERLYSWR